jgi:hypothetical protein
MPSPAAESRIPYPHLKSYMHQRVPLSPRGYKICLERWKKSPKGVQFAESLISRLLKWSNLFKGNRKWAMLRVIRAWIYWYYRIIHSTEIVGFDRIPTTGAIFYINHLNITNVVIPFLGIIRRPLGFFTAMGDSLFSDLAESIGVVPRRGVNTDMVERMVRNLLLRNRYFATWPEGTVHHDNKIMQGFSGIIKVYSVVNADRNRIPFVPVVHQVSPYLHRIPKWLQEARKQKKAGQKLQIKWTKWRRLQWKMSKREGLVKHRFTFLDPIYIPREWLQPPTNGGKTAREMMDYLMVIIARKLGQHTLEPNHLLDHRRANGATLWRKNT